jgi:hypothetical protein
MITLHLNDPKDGCPKDKDYQLRVSVRYDGKMIPAQMCECPFILDGILHVKAFVGGIDLNGQDAPEDIPYQAKPHKVFYQDGDFLHGCYYFDVKDIEPSDLIATITVPNNAPAISKYITDRHQELTLGDFETSPNGFVVPTLAEHAKSAICLLSIKAVILIPVRGRIKEVMLCMESLKVMIEDTDIHAVLAIDEEEDYNALAKWQTSDNFILKKCAPGQTLAAKKNQAVNWILDSEFFMFKNYLIELDSTGILSYRLFAMYLEQFKKQDLFFGVNHIAFHDLATGGLLDYKLINSGVWVSGRCIRFDLVRATVFREGSLWNPELNNGLGMDQENRVTDTIKNSPQFKDERTCVKIINTGEPMVLDLKTGDDVTPYEVLKGHINKPHKVVHEITHPEAKEEMLRQFGWHGL